MADLPKKRIIVAEDDRAISEVITIILQEANYTVTVSQQYDEILQLIKSRQADLLLLDISLSGKNGAELCQLVKKDPETKDVPIIMLSANSDIDTIAKSAGANDALQKPFDISALLEKVKYYLP